jgi:hypothetical protein
LNGLVSSTMGGYIVDPAILMAYSLSSGTTYSFPYAPAAMSRVSTPTISNNVLSLHHPRLIIIVVAPPISSHTHSLEHGRLCLIDWDIFLRELEFKLKGTPTRANQTAKFYPRLTCLFKRQQCAAFGTGTAQCSFSSRSKGALAPNSFITRLGPSQQIVEQRATLAARSTYIVLCAASACSFSGGCHRF